MMGIHPAGNCEDLKRLFYGKPGLNFPLEAHDIFLAIQLPVTPRRDMTVFRIFEGLIPYKLINCGYSRKVQLYIYQYTATRNLYTLLSKHILL